MRWREGPTSKANQRRWKNGDERGYLQGKKPPRNNIQISNKCSECWRCFLKKKKKMSTDTASCWQPYYIRESHKKVFERMLSQSRISCHCLLPVTRCKHAISEGWDPLRLAEDLRKKAAHILLLWNLRNEPTQINISHCWYRSGVGN